MSDKKNASGINGLNRRQFLGRSAMGAGALVLAGTWKGFAKTPHGSAPYTHSRPWKFGVMNDTQWTVPDDGFDPQSSAIGIIKQIQSQFVAHKVKFVVHVGDLCDNGSITGEDVRALYAQPLYDHGIGFFPLRGNHDDGAADAAEFQALYPQTQNGLQNVTPASKFTSAAASVPSPDNVNLGIPSLPSPGTAFQIGENFSSPDPWSNGNLRGLSYAFDCNNARFILLDQFTPAGGTSGLNPAYNSGTVIGLQQPWITGQLANRPSSSHAFVFAHKGLITCQHADVLFGSNPATNPTLTDAFINSMASNGVGYYIHGHDHIYDRSFVSTTTGTAKVMQILASSNSSKFYVPAGSLTNAKTNGGMSNDDYYDVPAFGIRRRQVLAQQLNSVGFQIVTIDGPNVTVEYYAVVVPIDMTLSINAGATSELQIPAVSSYNFTKQETFGYSFAGKQFVIPSGRDYTSIEDTSAQVANGRITTAKILAGTNLNQATDANGVLLTKSVNTGWAPRDCDGLASDILYLWGMGANLGSDQTDTFVLSMSYDKEPIHLGNGGFGIAMRVGGGNWVNVVDMNFGGKKKFVVGPWQSRFKLGTYGVDPSSRTAWAIINVNGQFAVAREIEPVPGLRR